MTKLCTATVTEGELAELGFPTLKMEKVMGTSVLVREGHRSFFHARALAVDAGLVRLSTSAEHEAESEARLAKFHGSHGVQCQEVLTFLLATSEG